MFGFKLIHVGERGPRGCGYLVSIPPSHIFPVFQNYENMGYLMKIIFDRCCCSTDVISPVKYGCDLKNWTSTLTKIENFLNRRIDEWSIIVSENGLQPSSAKPFLEPVLTCCWLDLEEQTSGEKMTLHWRHNERDCVSNHQPRDCLLNRLFRRKTKKISKLRVTGLCEGNSPLTGEFPRTKGQ